MKMNFKYLPNKTKLSIYKLLLGGKLKYFISKFYLLISRYKIEKKSQNSNDIIFVINHEKIIRNDHIHQFRYIYDCVNKALGYKVSYFEIKRVFNWNIFEVIQNLINYKIFFNIINNQMNDIVLKINSKEVKKLVVFADTVPLQNYICEFYNNVHIETYSLQHGFYIPDDNKIFELVYKSSNAKNFFVWDKRTLRYMSKYKGNLNRNFIKTGPISKNLYTQHIKKNKKNDKINTVAVYGCGKDQLEQNKYLVNLHKYLKKNTELKIIFISHPRFTLLNRLAMSIKYKIIFHSNKAKTNQFDLHLVLNSGVWLELEEQEERYFLLNQDFDENVPCNQTCINILQKQKSFTKNTLKPFFKDLDSVEIIVKNITRIDPKNHRMEK